MFLATPTQRVLTVLALTGITIFCVPETPFAQARATQCVACHRASSDVRLSEPAMQFAETDVHRARDFSCADCHGGDGAATDAARAHDRGKAGFRGVPAGEAVVKTCATCHSDAERMRHYAPRQRVDQETEYATSVHGKKLAQGDRGVATCVSCHGAHGVRSVRDAKSPVYPTNVAATCATCHASPSHMAGRRLATGSPVSTTQLADYQASVHGAALAKGDTRGAPTCNDCHGNHGAAPPGVGAVANVCGTCHAVFAERFGTSVHKDLFEKGCAECHGNHAVAKASDDLLGSTPPGVCATCHSGGDTGAHTADAMRTGLEQLKSAVDRSTSLIARIRNAGMEVGEQELALAEARTQLTLARTDLHASDRALLDPVFARGLSIVAGVDAAGQHALDELRFRRIGLGLSLAAILVVVVALVVKIRAIDTRHAR